MHQNTCLERVKTDKYAWLFILIAGICFYILNFLTPEYLDDYFYKFIYEGWDDNTNVPITNIGDIVTSQINHYQTSNGRFVVHCFVQLFNGIIGKEIFNVVNAIVFCCFIYCIVRYTNYKDISVFTYSIVTSLVLCFIPAFNNTFLWMTGGIGYLWSALGTIVFLIVLRRLESIRLYSKSLWYVPLFFVFGIVLGWTHEGITFALSLSLLVYLFINKSFVKSWAFPIALGFVVGGLLCVLSPATLNRGGLNEGFSIISKCISAVTLCAKLRLFYVMIILIMVRKYLGFTQTFKSWVKENLILVLCLLFSLAFLFTGFTGSRSAFGIELYSLLLIMTFVAQIPFSTFVRKVTTVIMIAISLLIYGAVLPYSIRNYSEYNSLISQIENTNDGIVLTNETKIPNLLNRFVQTPLEKEGSVYNMGYSYEYWQNKYIAKTYGKDSLVFIPRDLIGDIKLNPSKYNDFYTEKEWPFYVKKVEGVSAPKSVTFLLNETDFSSLPFYIRPFAHKMEKYTATEISAGKYVINNLHGDYYLMVGKNWLIDNRVKKVVCVPE